jgi:Tfp pilus assembly protein PilX
MGQEPKSARQKGILMSTGAWIIIVIVIIVILAVLAFVFMNRRATARRARAEKIRQEATERAAELDRKEAEANAMAAQAQDARAEADRLESVSSTSVSRQLTLARTSRMHCARPTVSTPTRATEAQLTLVRGELVRGVPRMRRHMTTMSGIVRHAVRMCIRLGATSMTRQPRKRFARTTPAAMRMAEISRSTRDPQISVADRPEGRCSGLTSEA